MQYWRLTQMTGGSLITVSDESGSNLSNVCFCCNIADIGIYFQLFAKLMTTPQNSPEGAIPRSSTHLITWGTEDVTKLIDNIPSINPGSQTKRLIVQWVSGGTPPILTRTTSDPKHDPSTYTTVIQPVQSNGTDLWIFKDDNPGGQNDYRFSNINNVVAGSASFVAIGFNTQTMMFMKATDVVTTDTAFDTLQICQ